MKKAIIIYKSRTGTTKKFGEKIHDYLINKEIISHIKSIDEIDALDFSEYDYIFLGCWTSGLLFFMQKPEKSWIEFAQKMPILDSKKTVLFTTYKIRTGSMFNGMRRHLLFENDFYNTYEFKSRNGELSENNQLLIDMFL
jgi:flavodoxin